MTDGHLSKPILFVGDTHADASRLIPRINRAHDEGVEYVVQVGDFGYWPRHPPLSGFVEQVSRVLVESSMTLYFVRGNHEDQAELARLAAGATEPVELAPRVCYVPDGTGFALYGVRLLGVGGAPSIDRRARTKGYDWWPAEVLSRRAANSIGAVAARTEVDVVVAHDCPAETDLPGLLPWAAGERHRRRMSRVLRGVRPAWWISGHYHLRHSQVVRSRVGEPCRVEVLSHEGDGPRAQLIVEAAALRRRGDAPQAEPGPGDPPAGIIRLAR